MDVATLYSLRSAPKVDLSPACMAIIEKMRRTQVTYKPVAHVHGRRGHPHGHGRRSTPTNTVPDNWRIKALIDTHRRLKEREDPEYHVVVTSVNKLSNEHFDTFVKDTLEVIGKRDHVFRLRISTLLFDRGVLQNFFAPLISRFIKVLVEKVPDMREDILAQVEMFDTLYDAANVVIVPHSSDPAYSEAIFAWVKQKEKKRGFAVMVGELYTNGLVPVTTIKAILNSVLADLETTAAAVKTDATEEHVDHLARFLFAVAPNVRGEMVDQLQAVLDMPRPSLPSLTMKSRFKIMDALKVLKSPSV